MTCTTSGLVIPSLYTYVGLLHRDDAPNTGDESMNSRHDPGQEVARYQTSWQTLGVMRMVLITCASMPWPAKSVPFPTGFTHFVFRISFYLWSSEATKWVGILTWTYISRQGVRLQALVSFNKSEEPVLAEHNQGVIGVRAAW
jgi:hypothetical protein